MECWLPYGNTEVYVTVNVRDLLSVAEPIKQESSATTKEILSKAFSEPRGAKKIEELVGPQCTVAISVDGSTNPTIATIALNLIVEQLVGLIVPKDKITIIVASGTREKSSQYLLKAIRGSEELKGVILQEHVRNTTNYVNLGVTRLKTPVEINRTYSESSIKLAIGETIIDNYTGFRGAFTSIFPGLASYNSIEANRKLVFKNDIKPGIIELNPIKEDTMEAIKFAGCDLALNLVTNNQGKLLSAFAGSVEESWGQAIYALGSSYQITTETGADLIIVSAGGSKFDYDLYSSIWAIQGAARIARKGSVIILLAECPDGLGSDTFSSLAHIEQLSELERRYSLGAEALHLLKSTSSKCQIFLVSSLPKYMVEPLGISVFRTANEAYDKALEGRRGRKTLIIPYGCSTIPVSS